ncbi:PLP-dependent aminotransferase family protein [Microbacterium sp. STN6]|uniref:MocR-like pyridoxine biosynthesis transcription factor PdxR n=1 Tax=Microbacterium sp. STN6 TaxID=2995588 RepID=UPI002260D265|nr:PLP-dependent aminotransferase family protein [Microbacterium sp. STN6]MCX7522903.1 PLP-dependent aminotransferase family protein [Microbacterium sp. STN6]
MRITRPSDLALSMHDVPRGNTRTRLADELRRAILGGRVRAGDALPSSRALAASLGVARGTVVAAYDDLAGEGYAEVRPGAGTFVAAVPAGAVPTASVLYVAASPAPTPAPAPASAPDASAAGASINLSPGHPSTRSFPHREWAAAWRGALASALPGDEPPASGLPQLREQIARHLRPSRGIECGADDVIVVAGTRDALALLTLTLAGSLGGAPRIACELPGHRGGRRTLVAAGAERVPIPVVDGGMDLAALHGAGRIDAALVTPSHQFPLGGRLDVSRRLELLEWAEARDALVIEDDYDSEFRHGASVLPAMASLDRSGRVLHVGSFSKVLSPWLRLGYIVTTNGRLRDELLAVRTELGSTVPGMVQDALARYMASGALRRHLARARRQYAHRRRLIVHALEPVAAASGGAVALDALDGGLHAVISWPLADERGVAVRAALARRSVLCADLDEYYGCDGPAPRDGIVIGYGACTDVELGLVLEDLRVALG